MKILIATDGSVFGSAALAKACEMIGRQKSTDVLVLTAFQVPAPAMTEPFVPMPVYSQEVVNELRGKAEEIALAAEKQLRAKFLEGSIASLVLMDEPGSGIISIARDWHADLIIVGSHGHGFLGRVVLGSVSDYVVHNAPCSVMVVRTPPNSNGKQF